MLEEFEVLKQRVLTGSMEALEALSVMAWSSSEARKIVDDLDAIPQERWSKLAEVCVVTDLGDGGVKRSDWSVGDQKKMSSGRKPVGYPEHRNV